MRIVAIHERTVAISRYADPTIPSGGLTTSIVALVTDAVRDGKPVVGYGFASVGRFGQGGLIRERFAPRLLAAKPEDIGTGSPLGLDPLKAWRVMMAGEKPGGHGERCVAVGTLDMALWDAAAKLAGLPLYRFIAQHLSLPTPAPAIEVYASGGYRYPSDDLTRIEDEFRRVVDLGYRRGKIKFGGVPLFQDLKRLEAVQRVMPRPGWVAVDAMNSYGPEQALEAARALAPLQPWWFEDLCDPLDFDTHAAVAKVFPRPIAAGEALFSAAEAKLLAQHGGLRPGQDILLFDPVHCYGLPGYVQIIEQMETRGWPRSAFWPHGGHLFAHHLTAALGLGGGEVNPFSFLPFGGLYGGGAIDNGRMPLPEAPGIGFETKPDVMKRFQSLNG